MARKMSPINEDLASALEDKSGYVNYDHNQLIQLLDTMRNQGLDNQGSQLQDFYDRLEYIYRVYQHRQAELTPRVIAKVKAVKTFNLLRRIAAVVLLITGVILFLNGLAANHSVGGYIISGLALIVIAIVGRIITKRMAYRMATDANVLASSVAYDAKDQIGHAETIHDRACGLYAEADAFYLSTMDPTTRGFELQRRQMEKQMALQQEQHQQAMASQEALRRAMVVNAAASSAGAMAATQTSLNTRRFRE